MTITTVKTISGCMGKGSMPHNRRSFTAANVDADRTESNEVIIDDNVREVYDELFGGALERYNDKQKRPDRKIEDYYEHIRTGKQEKLFNEVIFQMGNKDDTPADDKEEAEKAKRILEEFTERFIENNPNLRVIGAFIHMDEATPHVHIDFIPYITDSKRGLDTRVTLKGALKVMGYEGTGRRDTEWNHFINAQKEMMAEIMAEKGIGWLKKDSHEEHLDVYDFKVKMRKEELAKVEAELEEAEAVISYVEDQIGDKESRVSELISVIDDKAARVQGLDTDIMDKTKQSRGLDAEIAKRNRDIESLAGKEDKILELNELKITRLPFNMVSISKDTLDYLLGLAKKYIAYVKDTTEIKALRNQLKSKDKEIKDLNSQVAGLNDRLKEKTSLKDRLGDGKARSELDGVKKENGILRSLLIRLGFEKEMQAELNTGKKLMRGGVGR